MERGWIETIQLLGLDVVLMATIALLTLDWLSKAARPVIARLDQARRTRNRPAAAGGSAGQPAAIAWPPAPWRTSH